MNNYYRHLLTITVVTLVLIVVSTEASENKFLSFTDDVAAGMGGIFLGFGQLPKFFNDVDFDELLGGNTSEIMKALRIYVGIAIFLAMIVVINLVICFGCCCWCCCRCCCRGGCCRKNTVRPKDLDKIKKTPSRNCMICCQVTTIVFVTFLIIFLGLTMGYSLYMKDKLLKENDNVFSDINTKLDTVSTDLGDLSTSITGNTAQMATNLFDSVATMITTKSNTVAGAPQKKAQIGGVTSAFATLDNERTNTDQLADTMQTASDQLTQLNTELDKLNKISGVGPIALIDTDDIAKLQNQQGPLRNYGNDIDGARQDINNLNDVANDMGAYVQREFGSIETDLKQNLDDSVGSLDDSIKDFQSSITSFKGTVNDYQDLANDNKVVVSWGFNGLTILSAIFMIAALLIMAACVVSFLTPYNHWQNKPKYHKGMAAKLFVTGIVILFAFTLFYLTIFPLFVIPLGWIQVEFCTPVKSKVEKLDEIVVASTKNTYLVDNYVSSLSDIGNSKIVSLLWKECPDGVELADSKSFDRPAIEQMSFFDDIKTEAAGQIAGPNVFQSIDDTTQAAENSRADLAANDGTLQTAEDDMNAALGNAEASLTTADAAVKTLINTITTPAPTKIQAGIVQTRINSVKDTIATMKTESLVIGRIRNTLTALDNSLGLTLDGDPANTPQLTLNVYLRNVVSETSTDFSDNILDNVFESLRGIVSCAPLGRSSKALADAACQNTISSTYSLLFYYVMAGLYFFVLWCLSCYLIIQMTHKEGTPPPPNTNVPKQRAVIHRNKIERVSQQHIYSDANQPKVAKNSVSPLVPSSIWVS